MTAWLGAVLDVEERRPAAVTLAAALAVLSGGATLVGATVVIGVVFTEGEVPWLPVAVAVIQVTTAALLVAGGARLSTGAGRGVLFCGIAAQFVTCGIHALYAVTVVAANPDEADQLVPVLLTISGSFAAVAVVTLCVALRPSVARFLS